MPRLASKILTEADLSELEKQIADQAKVIKKETQKLVSLEAKLAKRKPVTPEIVDASEHASSE
jgi:uncharacterized coiled-coil protein SlyX